MRGVALLELYVWLIEDGHCTGSLLTVLPKMKRTETLVIFQREAYVVKTVHPSHVQCSFVQINESNGYPGCSILSCFPHEYEYSRGFEIYPAFLASRDGCALHFVSLFWCISGHFFFFYMIKLDLLVKRPKLKRNRNSGNLRIQ